MQKQTLIRTLQSKSSTSKSKDIMVKKRMSRSGMEIYDGIMRHVGVIKPYEHWNEDVYADANGDW